MTQITHPEHGYFYDRTAAHALLAPLFQWPNNTRDAVYVARRDAGIAFMEQLVHMFNAHGFICKQAATAETEIGWEIRQPKYKAILSLFVRSDGTVDAWLKSGTFPYPEEEQDLPDELLYLPTEGRWVGGEEGRDLTRDGAPLVYRSALETMAAMVIEVLVVEPPQQEAAYLPG